MVKTPKYWERQKRFKEKVKVKTMYGNEVSIPKIYKGLWGAMEFLSKRDKNSPQAALDGAMKTYGESFRKICSANLLMVFVERFKEDEYTKRIRSDE